MVRGPLEYPTVIMFGLGERYTVGLDVKDGIATIVLVRDCEGVITVLSECRIDANTGEHMATKHNDKCLEKAADDEPIFVLRAKDNMAPDTVRVWARTAQTRGVAAKKVKEAFECADKMEAWAKANGGAKDPD